MDEQDYVASQLAFQQKKHSYIRVANYDQGVGLYRYHSLVAVYPISVVYQCGHNNIKLVLSLSGDLITLRHQTQVKMTSYP